MASGSGGHVYNSTLAASVDVVLLTDPGMSVKVTNLSGTPAIYFTVSRPGGNCPVPSVGNSQCFTAASVTGNSVNVRHDGQFGTIIQLISSGTPAYMCEVQSLHATS